MGGWVQDLYPTTKIMKKKSEEENKKSVGKNDLGQEAVCQCGIIK